MTRYLYILCLACCLLAQPLSAQHAYFPLKGIISFEKEVYTRARLREMASKSDNQNRGMMMRFGGNIDDVPEKSSSMFTLQFDEDETLMLAVEEDESNSNRRPGNTGGGGRGRPQNNTRPQQMGRTSMRGAQDKVFYQNLTEASSEIQIELDEKYILKDSLQQITWRFTNEYRDIAGYECRRVNGSTPDSLYIVAFYTDQIPVSGGPALVHGLPGMILGIAIPEMHINYWARKVDFVVDNVPKSWRDKKSKEMTMESFFKSLENNRIFGGGGSNRNQTRRNLLENLIY
ncbi:GLPGLI family protein [Sphingobacterium oryzagri]|uniref:GLPGLI family protein n=1 Tax=Sphingobacterium oryzagri TaxID=3025669 RepID=A0ABY7WLX3_9SPHI|nr:GLPGLI family protein [Sphingobacterium sp. KACC 22765]WDF69310.1 GLPGLI family protein [Sphingobacterium sp. KACC 22765]